MRRQRDGLDTSRADQRDSVEPDHQRLLGHERKTGRLVLTARGREVFAALLAHAASNRNEKLRMPLNGAIIFGDLIGKLDVVAGSALSPEG